MLKILRSLKLTNFSEKGRSMGVTRANQSVISISLTLVNPDLYISGEQGVCKDLLYNKADHSLKALKNIATMPQKR